MNLSIVEIIIIFFAALAGTLAGLYIAMLIIKSLLYPDRKPKDCVHKERRKKDQNAEPSKQEEKESNEDPHQETQETAEEKKYSEGSVLSEKLKRDEFSAYDYNSQLDGTDPRDKIRERQSHEDEAYSILKPENPNE